MCVPNKEAGPAEEKPLSPANERPKLVLPGSSPASPSVNEKSADAATPAAAKSESEISKGEQWVRSVLTKGVNNTMGEFRPLARWKPEKMTTEAHKANPERTRYMDVLCQDDRRVVLKYPGLNYDFIHANYVSTPTNDKRFLCTQGPLENTQLSFWAMVVQENVDVILMLCNTVEMGREKCYQYYPKEAGETMKFGEKEGEITVTTTAVATLTEQEKTVRVLTMKVAAMGKERVVKHYQWEDWPDRGVPPTTSTALELIKAVRDVKTPIVVHCSAGIGRTGTIVGITQVQEKLQKGECFLSMADLVKDIRRQRPFSVQNDMQYIYIHHVVLTYLLEKERHGNVLAEAEMNAKWEEWKKDYDKATDY